MADAPKTTAATPPADKAPLFPAIVPTTSMTPALGAEEARRDREQAGFTRKLAADDAKRADAPKVTLIASTSFTFIEDPDEPEGRAVNMGDEFEVSEFDLPRFLGRGHLKVLEAPSAGVSIKST